MTTRVAINGFGRIGRNFFRAVQGHGAMEIVAINDLAEAAALAHLLKYDSVRGTFSEAVGVQGDSLQVGGRSVAAFRQTDPGKLPWKELGIDIVIEASGRLTEKAEALKHLQAGAGKVIISAPSDSADATLCMGVNHDSYSPLEHRIVSNASCTTNCLAPVSKVLLERFGIVKGVFNTVHCYTNGQVLNDAPQGDLRRSRAAGMSMIPTSTGADKALVAVLPQLAGRMAGMAVRVPTPNVSLIDLVVETARLTCVAEVNAALSEAAAGGLAGILDFCDLPLVSTDFNGNPASAIIDGLSTEVVGENLVRIIAWYDNEWGYSNRLVELVAWIARRDEDFLSGFAPVAECMND